jgi:hypothetical protein
MNQTIPTDRQQYWLTQIEACKQQSISMKAYAKLQGFSPRALYDAKKSLVKAGLLSSSRQANKRPLFKKAELTAVMPRACTITFPNGIRLDWPSHAVTAQLTATCKAIQSA